MKEILDSAPNKFCPVLNNVLLGAWGVMERLTDLRIIRIS